MLNNCLRVPDVVEFDAGDIERLDRPNHVAGNHVFG